MQENRSMLPARLNTRGVKSAYQRIAPFYDLWGKLTESRAHDLCLEWLDLTGAERILDVATGTGALLGKVVAAAPRATAMGADLTPAMLRRAAARGRESGMAYHLIQADARRLPIRSGTMDLLINAYMFDLLPQRDFGPVLREFSRVLSPHGRLALINMTVAERFTERIWETVYRIRPSLMGGCRGVQMAEPLAQAGFVIRRHARVSQLAFPSEVVLASRTVSAEHAVDL
jgi:ubiquinone/menaquinone biosynthesis C-methylase UbiE